MVVPKPRVQLSECAELFASAVTDPFGQWSGVCVPDTHDLPSFKLRTLIRGTMTVGTLGYGFVTISSQGACNNNVVVRATTSAFAGLVVPTIATTGVNSILNLQFPYTAAAVNAGDVLPRVAVCGARIRYIGSELNRSGQLIAWKAPTSLSMIGKSTDVLLSNQAVQTYPVTRQWHGITYFPTLPDDSAYVGASNDLLIDNNADLGFAVAGAIAGTTYEYEVVWYHEIAQGFTALANVSPSHSDLHGFSIIRNFLEGKYFDIGKPMTKLLMKLIQNYAPTNITQFVNTFAASTARPTPPLDWGL